MKNISIGERLKKLRDESKLSQEEVATVLGTTKQTIHKYERNIIENIPLERIETLAKIYNVSPSYIVGWEEEPKQEPKKELTIGDIKIERLAAHSDRPLTEEEQVKLREYAKFLKLQRMRENE